jgi:hypothetical protein
MFRIAHGQQRKDAVGAQSTANVRSIVGTVPQDAVRTAARPTTQPSKRRNAIEQWQGLGRIVTVGSRQSECQWNAVSVADQMAEQLPTTARGQSIWPSHESQFSNTKCINSQIPACCQSRSRRQQVMPEPQPNSFGSIRQGLPLRSTNMMPERHFRSARYGRPPRGLGKGGGRRNSINSHNVSGTSSVGMAGHPNTQMIL